MTQVQTALLVTLEAKPGKEAETAAFLKSALPLVNAEPDTIASRTSRDSTRGSTPHRSASPSNSDQSARPAAARS